MNATFIILGAVAFVLGSLFGVSVRKGWFDPACECDLCKMLVEIERLKTEVEVQRLRAVEEMVAAGKLQARIAELEARPCLYCDPCPCCLAALVSTTTEGQNP